MGSGADRKARGVTCGLSLPTEVEHFQHREHVTTITDINMCRHGGNVRNLKTSSRYAQHSYNKSLCL